MPNDLPEDRTLEISLRLLRDGVPDTVPTRYGDEHPALPLAVDVDDGVAVTALVGPGPRHLGLDGMAMFQHWTFVRRGRNWRVQGVRFGSADPGWYPLARRPAATKLGAYLVQHGVGETSNERIGDARQFRYAALRAAAEVARVKIGTRQLPVGFHGHLVVVWSARRSPVATALAADGTRLATVQLRRPAS